MTRIHPKRGGPPLVAAALVLGLLAGGFAAGQEAGTPYQKLVGGTFAQDLDGQPVTVKVAYDGLAPDGMMGLYKHYRIDTKDRLFLAHHDPAGQPGTVGPQGVAEPPFPLSLPKSSADALLALKPGTVIEVKGTAHHAGWSTIGMKVEMVYVEGASMTVPSP